MSAKRALRRGAALVGLVAAATTVSMGTPAQATGSAPALALPLATSGNRIVDADGATVVLRGLQRDGTQGGAGSSTIKVAPAELGWMGFQQPGSWHATVVRVPL